MRTFDSEKRTLHECTTASRTGTYLGLKNAGPEVLAEIAFRGVSNRMANEKRTMMYEEVLCT
jgi:hypothetical protein